MKSFVLGTILVMSHAVFAHEHRAYQFLHDPIDVVIVCHEKDLRTLGLAIEGIKKNIDFRDIFVVSKEPLTQEARWFDEAQFPFTKQTVAMEIFGNQEQAVAFLNHPKTRIGWIYQQLCKLYALFVIPDISSNVLVVDADTIFLRPVRFQDDVGAPLFNVGTEYHMPYFEHIARLIPGLKKVYPDKSGITHHMLFQRCIMEDLFATIRDIHDEEPWKALCHAIDHGALYGSALSEYELYFNFACMQTDQVRIRHLDWQNLSFSNYHRMSRLNADYVSCHAYM